MKLLRIEKNEDYQEIDVEQRGIFFGKKVKTYRKIGRSIFQYKRPNNYRHLGIFEESSIAPLFKIEKLY